MPFVFDLVAFPDQFNDRSIVAGIEARKDATLSFWFDFDNMVCEYAGSPTWRWECLHLLTPNHYKSVVAWVAVERRPAIGTAASGSKCCFTDVVGGRGT